MNKGRKYRMAWAGLMSIVGLTLVAAVGLYTVGEHQLAGTIVQVGLGSVSGILATYLGGQSWIDARRGEPAQLELLDQAQPAEDGDADAAAQ